MATVPPRTAGRAYPKQSGGVADCMSYDPIEPVIRSRPAPAPPSEEPRAVHAGKAKSTLPAHTLDPAYKFGAPTRWASTAKDVLNPAPLSPAAAEAEVLYKVSHRRLEPGAQRTGAAWWQTAGVDPKTAVFGKPSGVGGKDQFSVALAMGGSSVPSAGGASRSPSPGGRGGKKAF